MRHLRRLVKHTGWIIVALACLWAVRTVVDPAWLRGANDAGGSFLQTFGGMYGVIIAFAMYVVWQQHNETQVAIEREATTLLELWTLLGQYPVDVAQRLRARLERYARVVPRLNCAAPEACAEDDQALLRAALADFFAVEAPGRLFEPTLDLFHELNEAREHRLTVSRFRLAEGMRWFVRIGGALTVLSLCVLYVEAVFLQAFFVAGMTWVVVGAASIIFDLDDPYTGDFIVNFLRFEEVAKTMETWRR